MRTGAGSPGPTTRAPLLTIDRIWTLIAVSIPVIGGLALSMSTVDLTYHVRLGEQLLHGSFPRTDLFTFSAAGAAWTDQQWLAQMILALVHRAGGWNTVLLLKAGMIGVTFGLVFAACRASGASARAAAGLTVASYLMSSENLGMRPQLFAVPLFAATLWISCTRRQHPRRQWAIPVIVAIWANVHGSFVLGPLLVGLDWLEDRHDRSPGSRQTLAVGLASLAATLLTPFGWRVWTYTVEIGANHTITRLVSEWEATTIRSLAGAGLFASVAFVVWILARRSPAVPWPTLLRLLVFLVIALPAIRGVIWWALAAPVIVAGLLRPRRVPADPLTEADLRGSPLVNRVMAVVLLAALVVVLPWWRTGPESEGPPILDQAPEGLAAAAARVSASGDHLWVDQVWGSWFEYRLPDRPVFVDSRIELFPERVWTDYLDVANGREGWQDVMDRWDVDVMVLSPGQSGALVDRIVDDPGWRQVYRDDEGSVYVRSV
jgi:hypothetical protein